MIEVAEKSHAILSPSGWATWGNCPGSVPLSDGIHVPTSSYAKEGTAAHSLLERCLNENADAEQFLGETYTVEGENFTVDTEMVDAVNAAIEIVRAEIGDGILQVEQTVPLDFMTGEVGAEGTCDIAIVKDEGKHLTIADFKYGKGVMVYASEPTPDTDSGPALRPNGQLAMYALGWLQKYDYLYDGIETVKLIVIQPRCEWTDEHEMSIDQLRSFEGVIREAAGAVEMERLAAQNADELTLVVGEKQCKFCNAKAICPALKASVSTALQVVTPSAVEDFADLTLPKQAAAVVVDPDVSGEKLAEFGRAIPLIEEAIKAVQAEIERRLFADQPVPGFYLGQGRKGPRKWVDEEVALKELTKSGRLKMSEATAKVPISPTAAEKLLESRPKIWAQLAPFISQSEGGAKVCREGIDKNKPYQIASAVGDFADVDAPKIVTSKAVTGGDGLFVEASDGTHIVIPSPDVTGPIIKLTHVGQPMAPLVAALEEKQQAAMADLM